MDGPVTASHPANPWQQAEVHLRDTKAVLDSPEDAAAQAHLAAFGDVLYDTALALPSSSREDLHAAARAYNRARRSAIRADHQRAAALRSAARELLSSNTSTDGAVVIDLLVAAIYFTVAAGRRHEKRGHEQQAAAAEQTLVHLRVAYAATAQPALTDLARRAPRQQNTDRYAAAVRQALPEHAERMLTAPARPALTTVLAQAETAGHRPLGSRSPHMAYRQPAGQAIKRRSGPERKRQPSHHTRCSHGAPRRRSEPSPSPIAPQAGGLTP